VRECMCELWYILFIYLFVCVCSHVNVCGYGCGGMVHNDMSGLCIHFNASIFLCNNLCLYTKGET
jgi:hypothetical protein